MLTQVERPNWWNWFAPTPVVMVTTYSIDSESYRCSPFSWVVPLSKSPKLFGILARRSSQTLHNVKRMLSVAGVARFTVSLMEPSPDVAQRVLETRSGKPGTDMKLVEVPGSGYGRFMAPVGSIVNMCAASRSVLPLEGTHEMIVGEVLDVMPSAYDSPLLFYFGRRFARADVFEVEGY